MCLLYNRLIGITIDVISFSDNWKKYFDRLILYIYILLTGRKVVGCLRCRRPSLWAGPGGHPPATPYTGTACPTHCYPPGQAERKERK